MKKYKTFTYLLHCFTFPICFLEINYQLYEKGLNTNNLNKIKKSLFETDFLGIKLKKNHKFNLKITF